MSGQKISPFAGSGPPLMLVLLLFFGSGCAALIYEIVWFQMLVLIIGSTAVSLGLLLGIYMAGMGLGSIAAPHIISRRRHPLMIFAGLELGTALLAILILTGLPHVFAFYSVHAGGAFSGLTARSVLTAICLLPPTVLMGATLPVVSRSIPATPRCASWLGFLYGSNITGAVIGCLVAGFYLLRLYDVTIATLAAAALNGTVALTAVMAASLVRDQAPIALKTSPVKAEPAPDDFPRAALVWPIYLALMLSGATALGGEVVWTRLLSLILGGTVYTFSIILAVFLLGLGLGSGLGSILVRGRFQSVVLLALCQGFLAGAIAWTAHWLALPRDAWPMDPNVSPSPWINFYSDLARCTWALLPATFLWGASFPLALAAASRNGDPARWVGRIYAANTLGGILGGVGFSLIFIPLLGTQQSQRWLIGLSGLSAGLLFLPLWVYRRKIPPRRLAEGGIALAGLVLFAAFFAYGVPKVSGQLIAFGRHEYSPKGRPEILFAGEGMNASIAVSESRELGIRNFHISGKIEASTWPVDMRLQRMLADLPALIHPHPRSVLVVGCGAGVTAGSFVVFPEPKRITICELEPLVPQVAAKYFGAENYDVFKDPRTRLVCDDARHYLLATPEKFDIITSDPIHPWVKGSSALYTLEYFNLVRKHLNPGGMVTQWVPLYSSTPQVIKSEIATFFEVFPNGTVWSNDENGKGYDLVLLGQKDDAVIRLDEIEQRLARPEYTNVVQSLNGIGFRSVADLFATYAGQARELAPWLMDARINRDANLRLQYLAGLSLNLDLAGRIYKDMVRYREFPDDRFAGSSANLAALKQAMAGAWSKQ